MRPVESQAGGLGRAAASRSGSLLDSPSTNVLGAGVPAHARKDASPLGAALRTIPLIDHVGGKPPHHFFFRSYNLDVQVLAPLL